MRFKKTALSPGSYRLPDGRTVSYSRTDLARLAQRAREMITAGLQIPVPWEHQNLVPLSEEEARAHKAKYNAGFVDNATVGPDGDLVLWLDIPGEDDAKRIPSVRFCSPEIRTDWRDGAGRLWKGPSLTHLALTPLPVQHQQRAGFQPVQMSNVIRLSLTDRVGESRMSARGVDIPADKRTAQRLDEAKLAALRQALEKLGVHLPIEADPSVDVNHFVDCLMSGLQTLHRAKNPAQYEEDRLRQEAEPAQFSLGGGAPSRQLSPAEVEALVNEHFASTGSIRADAPAPAHVRLR